LKVSVSQTYQRGPSRSRSCRRQHQAQAISQSSTQFTIADVEKQFALFSAEDVGGHGISAFNEKRFSALQPLARTLFTAPATDQLTVNVHSAMLV